MPEQESLSVFELLYRLVKPLSFAGTLNTENVLESVSEPVALTAGVEEKFLQLLILFRLVVERRQFLQLQILEMSVEPTGAGTVLGFVVGLHDGVGDLHVGQRVQHGHFPCDRVMVVDYGWLITAEDVWNRRIVLVGPFLDNFLSILVILALGQTRVFDKTGQFLKLLESSLESRLGELTQGRFVLVVANLLQHCIEMVLTGFCQLAYTQESGRKSVLEDKFHQSLGR